MHVNPSQGIYVHRVHALHLQYSAWVVQCKYSTLLGGIVRSSGSKEFKPCVHACIRCVYGCVLCIYVGILYAYEIYIYIYIVMCLCGFFIIA